MKLKQSLENEYLTPHGHLIGHPSSSRSPVHIESGDNMLPLVPVKFGTFTVNGSQTEQIHETRWKITKELRRESEK
jgi:hypothetical protein